MNYEIRHRTRVAYAGPVRLAQLNLRLRPAPWPGQILADYGLAVDPGGTVITRDSGPWLVECDHLAIREAITELVIDSHAHVIVGPSDPPAEPGPSVAAVRDAALVSRDLSAHGPAAYLYASPIAETSAEIAGWAGAVLAEAMDDVVAAGRRLMAAIHDEFRYDGTATVASTPPLEAFRKRRGVCQDFAHVMIVAARSQGIPAAYVSGYLRTLPPPGQEKLVGADAMHAWVALWCGDALGWIGFDPTNDMLAGQDHIFVAMGRDYADVAPLDGVLVGGGGQDMDVSVDVIELD